MKSIWRVVIPQLHKAKIYIVLEMFSFYIDRWQTNKTGYIETLQLKVIVKSLLINFYTQNGTKSLKVFPNSYRV